MGGGAALCVLQLLLLLLLRAAWAGAVGLQYCDWVAEDEWPFVEGQLQCPALPDGGNVTICCYRCWPLEEERLEQEDECPGEAEAEVEAKPAAASGAPAHDNLFLLLGLAAVILFLFLCLWACHNDRACFHGEDAETFSGSTPAFALDTYARLQSQDFPLSYGACSAMDPPFPKDWLRPHEDALVQFQQATSRVPEDEEDAASFSSPTAVSRWHL